MTDDKPSESKPTTAVVVRANDIPPDQELQVRMAARLLARQLGRDVSLCINGAWVHIPASQDYH